MNKRWFALVLTIALIPGCGDVQIKTAPSEALYETKPTETVGFSVFYEVPETAGAMEAFVPDAQNAYGFRFLDDGILLFSGLENTTLTLLDSDSFRVKAAISLPCPVFPEDPEVTVSKAGVTYVDAASRELVFLDAGLEETGRISLPEACERPILSADRKQLYYCTADSLRVLDLESSIDRPVRQMRFPLQEILSLQCDDSVLQCRAVYDDGTARTLFICANTGMLLHEALEDVPLWTDGDCYFSMHMDGAYRELLCGYGDDGPNVLVTDTAPAAVYPLPEQQTVLLQGDNAEGTTDLACYHLETGGCTARISLPDSYRITDIQPDPRETALWLLCHDRNTVKDVLCRWDLTASDPEDPQIYLQPRWDRENRDEAGLSDCRELAEQLSQKHGVRILLRTGVEAFAFTGYRLEEEYQVPLLREMLRKLDAALSCYPEGFLAELALPTENGSLTVCPVRSIYREGIPEAQLPSLLHRDDRGNIWLAVTPCEDLDREVNRLLCALIDCRVLSLSDAYDSWDRSSPSGSGHQDRVRILENAMAEGQERFFASGFMQSELRQLSLGIRESFEAARTADRLHWEQYLSAP